MTGSRLAAALGAGLRENPGDLGLPGKRSANQRGTPDLQDEQGCHQGHQRRGVPSTPEPVAIQTLPVPPTHELGELTRNEVRVVVYEVHYVRWYVDQATVVSEQVHDPPFPAREHGQPLGHPWFRVHVGLELMAVFFPELGPEQLALDDDDGNRISAGEFAGVLPENSA